MIVYKLTDKDGYTRKGVSGETFWKPGKVKKTSGEGSLCTAGWTHAYEHPLLAVLHDPIHGQYGDSARMWECDTMDGVAKKDGHKKLGTSKLKCLREIKKPKVTMEQMVTYAIACSLRVYVEESYVKWAEGWLSGIDRSKESAKSAKSMCAKVGAIASRAAEAEICALAAIDASAAWAAEAAVDAALWASRAALWASRAALWAAYVTEEAEDLDLVDCAREVFLVE